MAIPQRSSALSATEREAARDPDPDHHAASCRWVLAVNDPTAGRRTWFNDSDDEGEEPTLLDIALDLAAAGVPVFPCSSDKRPAISKAQGGSGFRDATTDLDR